MRIGPGSKPAVTRRSEIGRLVDAAQKGDREAVDRLVERTRPAADRFARRLVSDKTLIDDLSQEAMIVLISSLPTYDRRRDFWPWFKALSRNTMIDQLRKRDRVMEDLVDPAKLPEPAIDHPDYAAQLTVAQAIEELPPEMARAVTMHSYSDLTFAEMGKLTGISPDTWNSRYRHARQLLRAKLGDLW